VTDGNRLELDEELRQDSVICKRGIETDFWEVIKRRLGSLRSEALDNLIRSPPANMGEIAELQKTIQVVDILIADIEETGKLT
jgi:hypothetical protein